MVLSCSRMSLDHFTPSITADRKVTTRPIETRLSRIFEVKSPLRPIWIKICEYCLAWPWRSLSGSKMSCDTWSMSAPQRSRMSAQRSITASINSISTISPVIAGEDEGDCCGPGHVGVGLAHQRRRHVARGVFDVEAAGNLDFLHVLPGRHRDAREPLHGVILLRRRLDQIDPDR